MENLEENKIITKVNHKGKKRKRLKCRPGFKLSGGKCVPVSSTEKKSKKRAIRQAVKTKKRKGDSLKRKTTKKRLRALKKRKGFGL